MRTYLTAGASAETEIVPKPAARTANACNRPITKRVPSGTDSISGLPISRMRNMAQSNELRMSANCVIDRICGMNVLEGDEDGQEEPGLV